MAKMTSKKQLPPDPEQQNDDRARWAERAVKAFIKETGTERGDALSDLLCDLMHWADREDDSGTYFADQLARAERAYAEETLPD